ncbi:hypothetical protein [Xanthomonas arboricola]|nr:hypothetical protein XarbCFBP8149_11985 [Xanthomonas arboricola]
MGWGEGPGLGNRESGIVEHRETLITLKGDARRRSQR